MLIGAEVGIQGRWVVEEHYDRMLQDVKKGLVHKLVDEIARNDLISIIKLTSTSAIEEDITFEARIYVIDKVRYDNLRNIFGEIYNRGDNRIRELIDQIRGIL